MKDRSLPPRIFPKGRWYYLVRADGNKRIWTKLTKVADGLPMLYRKLADIEAADIQSDLMPAIVAGWRRDVSESTHSKKTQADDLYLTKEIATRFAEFRAADVRPPDVKAFLKSYRDRPRTHNSYRSMMRELMRYAEEEGHRDPGTNPVDSIRTMTVKARDRYITDSEMRRIKFHAIYSDQQLARPKAVRIKNRSGLMVCALVDMAYLTGQRIGDLLAMQWSSVTDKGILFAPSKVANSTGVKLIIKTTPALQVVIGRLRLLRKEKAKGNSRVVTHVFSTQSGQPYHYSGARTAWRRAATRAGIENARFHDLRAKAITDVDEDRGIGQAQRMGGHSTQAQTADYVRHKKAMQTGATR